MKKHLTFNQATMAIAVIACLAIAAIRVSAADGYPAVITATLPGGTNNTVTVDYDAGVGQGVYTSFKPAVVEIVLAAVAEADKAVTVKRSATGPTYHTATVTSNTTTKVSFETNDWFILRGDDIVITCASTNAGTVRIIGTEK